VNSIIEELHGEGLINRVAVKHCAWFFLILSTAIGSYVLLHEEEANSYFEDHREEHLDEENHVKDKLDDLMEQMNTNYLASEVSRRIDRTEYQIENATESLASVKRVIERNPDVPEIYYEDRDRYELHLTSLKREVDYLKAQM